MLSIIVGKSRAVQRPVQQCVRTYAVTMRPSHIYSNKRYPRNYSPRKNYLLNCYRRLLEDPAPLLFLNHANFDAKGFINLRRSVAALKPAPQSPPLQHSPAPESQTMDETPQLMVIKSSIFSVALRERTDFSRKKKAGIARLLSGGPLTVLTLPSLHPPQLKVLIRLLETATPPKRPPPTAEETKAAEEAARLAIIENPTPGRRQKKFKAPLPPELELKGALIEGRLFVKSALKDVSSLPTLDTLRGQLLGLISGPAMQIAGILNEASGAQLARTLEGFKKGLETVQEDQGQTAPT